MTSPSDKLHIQVEFTPPTNHNSPWSRDTLHAFDPLKNSTLVRDSSLVTVTKSKGLTDVDREVLLSQKFLISHPGVTGLTQHTHSSVISLNDSDADADDERPRSPAGSSFTDDCSDDESNDHENGSTDGTRALIESQATDVTEPAGFSVPPSLTRSTRIRFRTRVRVTSGLNPHRHSIAPSAVYTEAGTNTNGDGGFYYAPGSVSGSPSSSFSVPLHSRTDDEADRPGWGPLGQRVSLFTKKGRKKQNNSIDDDQSGKRHVRAESLPLPRNRVGMTETSPLLIPPPRAKPRIGIHGNGRQRKRRCYCSDCGIPSTRRLSPERIDEMFGKWPNRMLNYQWWWWNAEVVLCCKCLDESDDESY